MPTLTRVMDEVHPERGACTWCGARGRAAQCTHCGAPVLARACATTKRGRVLAIATAVATFAALAAAAACLFAVGDVDTQREGVATCLACGLPGFIFWASDRK